MSVLDGLYLIEFLHQTTTWLHGNCSCSALYLIEFLHQTTTSPGYFPFNQELYLIEFLHQTTTLMINWFVNMSCILLNFYIKPQQAISKYKNLRVVSYWISTSNHNQRVCHKSLRIVVSYWISTSNHNFDPSILWSLSLYLIEFLHQTTTMNVLLIIVYSCILLNFYIKPQLTLTCDMSVMVVSYWISTSNHNLPTN